MLRQDRVRHNGVVYDISWSRSQSRAEIVVNGQALDPSSICYIKTGHAHAARIPDTDLMLMIASHKAWLFEIEPDTDLLQYASSLVGPALPLWARILTMLIALVPGAFLVIYLNQATSLSQWTVIAHALITLLVYYLGFYLPERLFFKPSVSLAGRRAACLLGLLASCALSILYLFLVGGLRL